MAEASSANDLRVWAIRDISLRPVTIPSPVVPNEGITICPDCSPPSANLPARSSSNT